MAQRLWEYRKTAELDHALLASAYSGGIYQVMATDETGNLLLHIIEQVETEPQIEQILPNISSNRVTQMLSKNPFALLPKGFSQTQVPGWDSESVNISLSSQLSLAYPSTVKNTTHSIFPLYKYSVEQTKGHEHYMLCWVHDSLCSILYFRNGNCELANTYPAANESEILYFCMAAAKKAGADVRKVQFDILGDEVQSLLLAFQRYIPNAVAAKIELPYPAGEYPPQASISFLLYQFLTCELPEVV
jgi:Protein of unknown function (DUF3822)